MSAGAEARSLSSAATSCGLIPWSSFIVSTTTGARRAFISIAPMSRAPMASVSQSSTILWSVLMSCSPCSRERTRAFSARVNWYPRNAPAKAPASEPKRVPRNAAPSSTSEPEQLLLLRCELLLRDGARVLELREPPDLLERIRRGCGGRRRRRCGPRLNAIADPVRELAGDRLVHVLDLRAIARSVDLDLTADHSGLHLDRRDLVVCEILG